MLKKLKHLINLIKKAKVLFKLIYLTLKA